MHLWKDRNSCAWLEKEQTKCVMNRKDRRVLERLANEVNCCHEHEVHEAHDKGFRGGLFCPNFGGKGRVHHRPQSGTLMNTDFGGQKFGQEGPHEVEGDPSHENQVMDILHINSIKTKRTLEKCFLFPGLFLSLNEEVGRGWSLLIFILVGIFFDLRIGKDVGN